MSTSFGRELFRRRVPHIVGVYLAAGWAVLEFIDFLVNRYLLSPHLTDFAMLSWALMLPSVLMLAWYHGAPGRDRWTRVEMIGIPLNVVAAAALLVVAFSGKELGAATESVTVEDVTGEAVERVVPKSEFRKSLVIYYFDNSSRDSELDWLRYGLPMAIQFDLEQDLFVDARPTEGLMERFRQEGFSDGLAIPLTLKRQLAEDLHLGYFVTGTITRTDGDFVVTTSLYETRRGRQLQERTLSGNDVFDVVDRISRQIRDDLDIPAQHVEDTADLPIAEMLTSSLDAYRAYVEGASALLVDRDLAAEAEHLENAVAQDPQFAVGNVALFQAYMNLNQTEKGRQALQTAMGQLYKLPERIQLQIKAAYYWIIKQDIDKALTAAGMQAELFPEDVDAHLTLASLYAIKDDADRAIAALRRVLEIDPGRIDVLLAIGSFQESKGEFDEAFGSYRRYAAAAPNNPRVFIAIGDLHSVMGDLDSAKDAFDKALVLDPENVRAMVSLANVERDRGRFDSALGGYEDALAAAVTPRQRRTVYEALEAYYELRGKPNEAVDFMHRRWVELEHSEGPFLALQMKLQSLDTYVAAGMAGVALDTLSSIERQLAPPFDVLLPLGQLAIYLELEDADSVESALEGIDRLVEAFGLEEIRPYSTYAEGRVLELRGDCEQAIYSYRRSLDLEPRGSQLNVDIGRCYRELGKLKEAEAQIQRALDVRPFNPIAHYEIARVYADEGKTHEAREHLNAALNVWEDAEPVYKTAREARDLLSRLDANH